MCACVVWRGVGSGVCTFVCVCTRNHFLIGVGLQKKKSHYVSIHKAFEAMHMPENLHNATQCKMLQLAAPRCNKLQCTVTYRNTLHCPATPCNTLQHKYLSVHEAFETIVMREDVHTAADYNKLQHTATHCNKVQCTVPHCTIRHHAIIHYNTLHRQYLRVYDTFEAMLVYIHCNTPQHTPVHCNTLQHTAMHCNTLQHTLQHTV